MWYFLRIKCNVCNHTLWTPVYLKQRVIPPPPTHFVLTRLDLCPDIVFITWFMWYFLRIKCNVCNHTLWTPVYLKQRVIPPPPTHFVLTRLDLCPDIVFTNGSCDISSGLNVMSAIIHYEHQFISNKEWSPLPPTPFVLTRLDLCPDIVFITWFMVIFPQDYYVKPSSNTLLVFDFNESDLCPPPSPPWFYNTGSASANVHVPITWLVIPRYRNSIGLHVKPIMIHLWFYES